jgi:hypothetical protein
MEYPQLIDGSRDLIPDIESPLRSLSNVLFAHLRISHVLTLESLMCSLSCALSLGFPCCSRVKRDASSITVGAGGLA